VNNVAYIYPDSVVTWSGVVIALAVLCAVLVCFAFAVRKKGYCLPLAVMLPVAMALGCIFGRMIHWYCRTDQYSSFSQAFTDLTVGSFSIIGIIAGCLIAAVVVWALGLAPSLGTILDILAPGAALGIALGRLSFLFNYSDRGKIFVENEAYRRLPIGSVVINASSGAVEWRFATFFIQSLAAFAIFIVVVILWFRFSKSSLKSGKSAAGSCFAAFSVLYFMSEIILDSTRYDALFLRTNGFVSLMQIVGAVAVVAAFVYFSVRSVRFNGLHPWHFVLWTAFLAALGLAGYMEYYVQRHGGLYMMCYSIMTAGLAISAAASFVMLKTTLCVQKN